MVTKGAHGNAFCIELCWVQRGGESTWQMKDPSRGPRWSCSVKMNQRSSCFGRQRFKTDLKKMTSLVLNEQRHDPNRLPCLSWSTKTFCSSSSKALAEHGVTTKILTGDNGHPSCLWKVGLDVERILLGKRNHYDDDQELAGLWNNNGLCKYRDQKRGASLPQEQWPQGGLWGGSTMLHRRSQTLGCSVDTAVDIAKGNGRCHPSG